MRKLRHLIGAAMGTESFVEITAKTAQDRLLLRPDLIANCLIAGVPARATHRDGAALYTVLRGSITDVPSEYALAPEQRGYLTVLVIFHLVTIALVWGANRLVGGRYFAKDAGPTA